MLIDGIDQSIDSKIEIEIAVFWTRVFHYTEGIDFGIDTIGIGLMKSIFTSISSISSVYKLAM